ncbi:MAG: hypothetical protein QM726_23555 [Chitinophagaceae bacterium]
MQTQSLCKDFENKCASATSIADVAAGYTQIKNELLEARDIIEREYTRLKAFNTNQL